MEEETIKICCEDFRITKEDYAHIYIDIDIIRFTGHEIRFCPFCGKKIKVIKK
jgi:hypothetical protein